MELFSIPVKFKCKSCESVFEYVDLFIGHKKEKHLKEFQKLKCILFEEKTEATTETEGHRDGKHEISNEGSSLFAKSFPVHQELIEADSDCTGIVDNNAEIEQASSWGHQNLILYTSDNNTANFYSLNLLNPENVLQQADSNDADPLTNSIKQESKLDMEIELDADSESQFDYFLDDQSTSSSHEELAENNATPLSSVDIKYNVKNTCLKNKNEFSSNLTADPYVLIRRLTSKEIQTGTITSTSKPNVNTINYISEAGNRENPGHPPSKNIRRTNTVSSSHTGVTKTFSCDICDASFSQKTILSNHIITHSDLRPFKCKFPNCTSSFQAKRNLDQHQVSHSQERPFHCTFPDCNKSSKSRGLLYCHLKTHTKERPYMCSKPDCGIYFKTANNLQRHLRTSHGQINKSSIVDSAKNNTQERPFHCTFPGCNNSSKTRGSFNWHLKTHTEERPYMCSKPYCERSFKHASNLQRHVRTSHGQINKSSIVDSAKNSYACRICSLEFPAKSDFNRHFVVHLKPFKRRF